MGPINNSSTTTTTTTDEHVTSEAIFCYLLNNNNVKELQTIATGQFLQTETPYAIRIAEKIHDILITRNVEKSTVLKQLYTEKQRYDALVQKKASVKPLYHLDQEEQLVFNGYLKNKALYDGLPAKLRGPFKEFQDKITEASELMVNAAYVGYVQALHKAKASLDTTTGETTATTTATNNNNNMEIDGQDDDNVEEEFYKTFTNYVETAIAPIELPGMVLKIAKLLSEKNMGVLCVKICENAAKRVLEQRNREIEKLVRCPEDLSTTIQQIVVTSINSIFNSLAHLQEKVKQKTELNNRELHDLTLLQNGELLTSLIEFHIPAHLQSPEGILEIGNLLLTKKQYPHCILVTERARLRLDEIEKEQEARTSVQKQLAQLETDIQSIRKIGGKPDDAMMARLDALKHTTKTYTMLPGHCSVTSAQRSDLILKIAELRVKCILETKGYNFKSTIGSIEKQLNDTLDTLIDPTHIFKLAQILHAASENEATLRYGERCQRYIADLERLRETRLPLQQAIDALLKEESDLRTVGKTLLKTQKDKLDELNTKISVLPAWPFFGQLSVRHQYDNLHLDVAQLMISSVLVAKNNTNDAARREQITRQFDDLVQLCLDKFADPTYLLKFASHMKGSKEDKVLVRIVTQLFKRCNEIETARRERLAAQANIDSLVEAGKRSNPAKAAEIATQLADQRKAFENLPVWPHYAQLDAGKQYDATKYDASLALMQSMLDCIAFQDEKLRKKKMYDLKTMGNEEDLIKERDVLIASTKEALTLCLANLESLESIVKLANELGPKNEMLFIEIARVFHPKLAEYNRVAQDHKSKEILISLLEEELSELTKMKKDMADEDLALLEQTRAEKRSLDAPYMADYLLAHDYHSKMATLGIRCVYAARQAMYARGEPVVDAQVALHEANIASVLLNIERFVEDPATFESILTSLLERKEYSTIATIGRLAFKRITEFRTTQETAARYAREQKTLQEQKEALDKQRRRLPADKQAVLRDLVFKAKVFEARPAFEHGDLDVSALSIAKALMSGASAERTAFEATICTLNDDGLRQVAAQRKRLVTNTVDTAKTCVEQIRSLTTLMSFAKDLAAKKEHQMVLQVGKVVEDIIDEKRAVLEHQEQLSKDLKLAQGAFLRANDLRERKSLQETIDVKQAELDNVVPPYTYDEIKTATLAITDIMIAAANAEDLGEVIRDQTIISFKIDTTAEKWDAIRNLSSEEEWTAIKEELVVFVMKREENVNSKIELLMKDGLFKQCIEIFPHPSTDEDELSNQMVLLESLYEALDTHQYTLLPSVMPLVQRYAKRCYQEWKSDRLDTLFDIVQRRYPMEIKDMFEKATEMLLINILQSQYPTFLQMLKSFKRRMVVTLGLDSLWNDYLDHFKKSQKGKRRLIQMVNLIGDSVWQVEATNTSATAKGKAPATKKRANNNNNFTPMKHIKVSAVATPAVAAKKAVADDDEDDTPATPIQDENEDNQDDEMDDAAMMEDNDHQDE
eukprot:gene7206-8370_t